MSETGVWEALWLSIRVAVVATAVVACVAVPLAWGVSSGWRRTGAPARAGRGMRRGGWGWWGGGGVELAVLLPLVLPPTVVGYVLLVVFGRQGPLGGVVPVVFEFWGAVLAGAVVALPMLYVPARAAFAAIDRDLLDAAVVMGASRWRLFWSVGIPLARPGLAAGLVLALARALGEFGATVMVLGFQPDRQTLSIAVYAAWAGGDLAAAVPFVAALAVCSVGLLLTYNAVLSQGR